jgi:hypothetical protein
MQTLLDAACAAMLADPDDDVARLRYYDRLADAELFVLLEAEARGTEARPQVFPLEDGPVVLAFDTEDRLSDFSGGPAAYAALPGRVVVRQLAGQGTGIAVNLGAPQAWIVTPPAVDWLAGMLDAGPVEAEARPVAVHPPAAVPPALLTALDAKLARAGALAAAAVLAGVAYQDGRRATMLAFLDALPGAERALARAAAEALHFSGLEEGGYDVAFLASDEAAAQAMLRVGLRVDLPAPPGPPDPAAPPPAPGTDPDRPPRLR